MIQYTSDGRAFVHRDDLSDESSTRMLLIFEAEIDAAYGTGTDVLTVATRAAERVEARAIVTGTDPAAAEVIRNSAMEFYAYLITRTVGA